MIWDSKSKLLDKFPETEGTVVIYQEDGGKLTQKQKSKIYVKKVTRDHDLTNDSRTCSALLILIWYIHFNIDKFKLLRKSFEINNKINFDPLLLSDDQM